LPHQRANVDQVPLPFVNGMEDTLEDGCSPHPCSVTIWDGVCLYIAVS